MNMVYAFTALVLLFLGGMVAFSLAARTEEKEMAARQRKEVRPSRHSWFFYLLGAMQVLAFLWFLRAPFAAAPGGLPFAFELAFLAVAFSLLGVIFYSFLGQMSTRIDYDETGFLAHTPKGMQRYVYGDLAGVERSLSSTGRISGKLTVYLKNGEKIPLGGGLLGVERFAAYANGKI